MVIIIALLYRYLLLDFQPQAYSLLLRKKSDFTHTHPAAIIHEINKRGENTNKNRS